MPAIKASTTYQSKDYNMSMRARRLNDGNQVEQRLTAGPGLAGIVGEGAAQAEKGSKDAE